MAQILLIECTHNFQSLPEVPHLRQYHNIKAFLKSLELIWVLQSQLRHSMGMKKALLQVPHGNELGICRYAKHEIEQSGSSHAPLLHY